MSPPKNNLHPLLTPPPPKRLFAWWDATSLGTKSILGIAPFVVLIVGVTRWGDAKATKADVAAATAIVNAEIEEVRTIAEKADEDATILTVTMRGVTAAVAEIKAELRDVRKDLRRMDRGQPLPALPEPTPEVTP